MAAILVALALILWLSPKDNPIIVHGLVIDDAGPVKGAVIRFNSGSYYTVADSQGRFTISTKEELVEGDYLTGWAPGYLIGWTEVLIIEGGAVITLAAHTTSDDPNYEWFSFEGNDGSLSCSVCMHGYPEWTADAHSQSAINPRFLSLYNGTTVSGESGMETIYNFDQELVVDVPVAPSLGLDGTGPGFRLDFPELGGNCALCHAPEAATHPGNAYQIDMNNLSDIASEGVFCEFCHKIGEVYIRSETGLPDPSLPGVLSMRLFRPYPEENTQIFFGNFDDVPLGRRVTYLPLVEESAFCAPCHVGDFWGVTMYNSFGEWLESPYSDPESGQTCQDCHMPPVEYNYFVFSEKGGAYRESGRIFTHLMPGAMDEELLQNTAEVTIETSKQNNDLHVIVRVTNSEAGHHIPTDNPLRNMILLVSVTDANGQSLELIEGSIIPEWGGIGDPESGHYAGMPGVLYAKVLADFYTGETPTYAYWRQTRIVSDNRIAAFETDVSEYLFALPQNDGEITIDAQLLLRRAFIELMDSKEWDTPDILMEHETITIDY